MAAYLPTDSAIPPLDDVFKALADPSRRQLLDSLNDRSGQTLWELCSGLDMARQSVSKHLAVLEAANLVTTIRRGREKLHYLNPAPIHEISERWITHYAQERVAALGDLKRALEETAVDKPTFVYTTYIRTTPERLWEALTNPTFTRRYWGATFDTDWQAGSTMAWELRGLRIDDPEQVVVESDPPRRLSYRWHTLTTELADALDLTDDTRQRVAAEHRSTVTFALEPMDEVVKLTVVHDDFDEGSVMAQMVARGWPSVLSSLKSLLETGETLTLNQEPPAPAQLGLTR
jgi:uncharacterized protein YndB with AHSA1/START domain/DNA-binding transcriptional ArsR family regulator